MRKYQVRFWRATALVRESLTLIILHKGLNTVGLTVSACGRLSGSTPDEAGMPSSDIRKLTLYSQN